MKKSLVKIRHYFVTGLLITLPIFFTLYFIFVVVRFVDGIWGNVINYYLKKYLGFGIPGLGFILAVITIFLVGFVTANFLGRRIFKVVENWFLRLPFIRQIYPAVKQVVDFFGAKENPAFKKVVLVEYPSKGIWSIGFLTNDSFREVNEKSGSDLVHVFIAHSPSPLTGFLVLIPKSSVRILDISVEQGIKLIISAGIVKPAS